MATNPNLVNATAGQRLAARVVDSVPLLVLVLVALSIPGQLTLILCAVGAAGYLLWLWLWEAGSGQTPGNRLLGLRTVAEDGQAPGFPSVMVRNFLLLASAVTVVGPWILTVSNLWDYPHRRQGWHDKAARTLMVDIRAGRNPLVTGGRWIQGAPGPEPVMVAPGPGTTGPAAVAAAETAEVIGAGLPAAGRRGWEPAAEEPRRTSRAEDPAGSGPISSVPGAARPAVTPGQVSAPAQVPGSAAGPGQAPAPTPAPAAASGSAARPGPASGRGPGADPGPASGAGLTADPGSVADRGGEEDDVEMTRVVSRPRGAGRLLTFDDGATVRVTGTALLGRNPAAGIGESADQLIDFADMGRSVSKTHLHLQADGASGLWVTDRNSTNGSSIVAPDGRHVALEAHSPVLAPTGSTIYFGDRHFTIA